MQSGGGGGGEGWVGAIWNNILLAAQPCHTANEYWGLQKYHLWLLSPVTLQMGTGDCINIFKATQPFNTANGYWELHLWQLSPVTLQMGTGDCINISSWLLSPVTLQMGIGDCINIFMATQPCYTANGS